MDGQGLLLARISLALTAVAFGGFGLLLLVRPDTLSVVGVEIVRPAGAVELRGFYGGLEIGLAVFFFLALARRPWHVPALVVQIGTLGGAVVGRIFGLLVGGGWESWMIGLMTAEAAGAGLGVIALRCLGRPRHKAVSS